MKEVLKSILFRSMKEVLKKYTFQKHERSTKKYTFLVLLENFLYMLKVYFSEVLKKYTSQKHEKSTKKYTFLVLLASENFLSPNVLKVYFFHASSVLHFARNFENSHSLKFVKSSKSMLKMYLSEVLNKYTSQKHERSTKKYTFLVLLASENFLSLNVLKLYFFHASSVLHFTRNFANFQSLQFVKSSKSMLKVYFSEVLKSILLRSTKEVLKSILF